jgi:hypothetical protein
VSNRRDLSRQLDVYAGAYGLDTVTFPSFVVHILRATVGLMCGVRVCVIEK